MPGPTPYLFVYGSLQRGGPPEACAPLVADGRFLRKGSIAARLYLADGWPAATAPQGDGERVHGEVWELGRPGPTLAVLDAWEGPTYERRLVPVLLDNQGFEVECWAWFWTGPLDEAARIATGRWTPD
jgi:gamma-glutamylcyclotransferase (GGCT)/AIG2-like uncharacterized protein YtfP